ncbi:MAG: hypothetical protein IJP70_12040 [Bacteroidales bacterium]|nr:hypothetical protein [Bacteroidales bacterium]
MKRICIYSIALLLSLLTESCYRESEISGPASKPESLFSYRLFLEAELTGFGQPTRSSYAWEEGARLYLQLKIGDNRIPGVANYSQTDGQWTITTSRQIEPDTDGDCEAYFFRNDAGTSSQSVSLNARSAIYQDVEGSFTFTEDSEMFVKLLLSPRTGRVRFKGQASAKFGVSGLQYHTEYNITTNTFEISKNKISSSFDKSGDTDYFYVGFSNVSQRQLVVDATGQGVFIRSFDDAVLAAGQSGFISLPSTDNVLQGWTLVNIENQKEIVLPTVSAVEVSKIRSHFATAIASVSDLGNGTLSEAGFIYSVSNKPSFDNGTKVVCGKSSMLETRLAMLTAKTSYFIRSFATNERGSSYGEVVQFTTLSEEEDGTEFGVQHYGEDEDLNPSADGEGSFEKNGYGTEEDLTGNTSSEGTIGKDGYGDDDSLTNETSSEGTINKEGYGQDEDLNGKSSSESIIGKEGFGEDEDLNVGSNTEGTIGKEGHGSDEDLNENQSAEGTFSKEGYGSDEDLNGNPSTEGSLGKEGYGSDEDMNENPTGIGNIDKKEFDNDEDWN